MKIGVRVAGNEDYEEHVLADIIQAHG